MTDHVTQAAELVEATQADWDAAIAADDGAIAAARSLADRSFGATQGEMRDARKAHLAEAFARHRLSAELAVRSGEWEAIASAPKDGTRIIVGKWAWIYEDIVEAFKAGHEPARQVFHLYFATTAYFSAEKGYWTDGLDKLVEPTHWMPLPTPPAISSMEAPSHG